MFYQISLRGRSLQQFKLYLNVSIKRIGDVPADSSVLVLDSRPLYLHSQGGKCVCLARISDKTF